MNDSKHKIRLDLVREGIVVASAEPGMEGSEDDFKISSNSSVNTFPIALIESAALEVNAVFLDFSKSDLLKILVASDDGSPYLLVFQGEFLKKEIKIEGTDHATRLSFQAIHSFYRLSLVELKSTHRFEQCRFDDFIFALIGLATIDCEIKIAPELAQIPINGISRRTNAFRLFKEVCTQIGAFVKFNTDNSVSIDVRERGLGEMRSKVPITIADDDILSFSSSEEI